MKHIFTISLLLLSVLTKAASPTVRVLFIGNSFTGVEQVPMLVKGIAEKAGYTFEVADHTPGGISVGDVAQGQAAHMNNPRVFDLIRMGNWDFVVLQDNQGRFVEQVGTFPNPAVSKVMEGHLKILDSVKYYNKCARMILYAGWAWKDGYPGLAKDGIELIDHIWGNYKILNAYAKELIAPIGPAWKAAIKAVPNVDLWSGDGAHQSAAGAYLAAAVIYATIFRAKFESIPYNGNNVDPAAAMVYRRIAFETVRDSTTITNLANIAPKLTYTGTTLSAPAGHASYEWWRNDVLLSTGTTNTITVKDTACYRVVITGNGPTVCVYRSENTCLTGAKPSTGISAAKIGMAIKLYPNPATDMVTVQAGEAGVIKYCNITDVTGRVVLQATFTAEQHELSLSNMLKGVYLCTVQLNGVMLHSRLVKD